jgi:U3 small nucleolar RNA-associated protein 22
MAPPATKRRKLSHSSDDSADDNESFASFSSDDLPDGDTQSNEPPSDSGEDNGSEPGGEEMDVLVESTEEEKASDKSIVTKKRVAPRKMGDSNGTIYNGEVFRSNLFKLQVDELLDQVRPGHTRKNDSIESAVRTLKTIIEEIPARKPTSVRSVAVSSPKLKKDLHIIGRRCRALSSEEGQGCRANAPPTRHQL